MNMKSVLARSGREAKIKAEGGSIKPKAESEEVKETGLKSQVEFLANNNDAQVKLWLVKVPRFLIECWDKQSAGEILGDVTISNGATGPEVDMRLNEIHKDKEGNDLPTDFNLHYTSFNEDELQVFTEDGPGNIVVEGAVSYKIELRAKKSRILQPNDYPKRNQNCPR